jgi:hypothetical protein
MPRGVKKENLPTKVCVTCGRPFTWRKKWEKVWDEVTTCSKSCNHQRRLLSKRQQQSPSAAATRAIAALGTGTAETSMDNTLTSDDIVVSKIQELMVTDDSNKALVVVELPLEQKENKNGEVDLNQEESVVIYDNDPHNDVPPNTDDVGVVDDEDDNDDAVIGRQAELKALRKQAKKARKAARRAQLEGRGDPMAGRKSCDTCGKSVNLLIRCLHQEGQTDWSMVCGACWHKVSGGVPDGDANHPHYRYGGLWKNRRAQQRTNK